MTGPRDVSFIVIVVVIIALAPSTHCETLRTDGSYERAGF
jgi:hypothetical protein